MDEKRIVTESEIERDPLLRSTLDYWSSGVRRQNEPDPLRWEEGPPDFSGLAHWAMMLLTVGLVVLMLWQLGL